MAPTAFSSLTNDPTARFLFCLKGLAMQTGSSQKLAEGCAHWDNHACPYTTVCFFCLALTALCRCCRAYQGLTGSPPLQLTALAYATEFVTPQSVGTRRRRHSRRSEARSVHKFPTSWQPVCVASCTDGCRICSLLTTVFVMDRAAPGL